MAWHFFIHSTNRAGFRRGLVSGASGLLILATAGCGIITHTAGGSATTTSAASPRQTAPSPSASPTPLDGAQLASLLLPASAMPAGFSIDPSGTKNAAQALPQDMSQPISKTHVCGRLNATGWVDDGGITSGDFAENDYINASRTAEVAQEIDAYQPGDAVKIMSRLWQVLSYCRTFTLQAGGTTATVSLTRASLAGVGDQAIGAVQTSPAFDGGTSLVAIRIGYVIVTVLVSSPGKDKGAATAVAMAKRILGRVPAAQQPG